MANAVTTRIALTVARAVLSACKRQVEKSRSLDGVNLEPIVDRALGESAEASDQTQAMRPNAGTASSLATALNSMWKFASGMIEKHGMDGDNSMTDAEHAAWQDASGEANSSLNAWEREGERLAVASASTQQLLDELLKRGVVTSAWHPEDFDFLDDEAELEHLSDEEVAVIKSMALADCASALKDHLGGKGNELIGDWWERHKNEVLAEFERDRASARPDDRPQGA